ncbi:MAG: ABC transporter ATP-binding protein [Burkholderiaceae bacterium]
MSALLRIDGLEVAFGAHPVIERIDLALDAGRTLALVGESGSGKSVTALAVMGLLPRPAARVTGGRISFDGRDLLALDPRALRNLRGNRLAMIFQEPMSSLNPSYTVGEQIIEVLLRHRRMSRADASRRAIEVLGRVHIPAPEARMHEYPHQLSGGMRQRAMIAMALACEPSLLIADEPTTALDVTIQAQILALLRELQQQTGMAIVLITHDLGVVAELADDVAVMYAGRIVERAPVQALFDLPEHPYTVGLLGSMPSLHGARGRLAAIDGQLPAPGQRAAACRFAPRCPFAEADCRRQPMSLAEVAPGHASACRRAPLDPARLLPEPSTATPA